MNTTKIKESDIYELRVASLPTRPTLSPAYGGQGYTSTDLKEAFDMLPLYIIKCFNSLIDDLEGEGIKESVKTGISDGHTLLELFADITDGTFIEYAAAFDGTIHSYLARLRNDVDTIAKRLGIEL